MKFVPCVLGKMLALRYIRALHSRSNAWTAVNPHCAFKVQKNACTKARRAVPLKYREMRGLREICALPLKYGKMRAVPFT